MLTPQETEAINKLSTLLKQITEIVPDSLIRKEELGALSFEKIKPYLERNIALFNSLFVCDLSSLPHDAAKELGDAAQRFLSEIQELRNFNIQQGNSPEIYKQYTAKAIDSYKDYYRPISKHLPYLKLKSENIEVLNTKLQEQFDVATNFIKMESETFKNQIETVKKESSDLLTTIQSVAAEAGVSKHSSVFAGESTAHGRVARGWLTLTIILATVTTGFVIHSIDFYADTTLELTSTQNVQLAIAKIIGFSLLFFALKWSSKNYAAHRHNQVVNKHRQNALTTFEAFVKATNDPNTKEAVLLRSTETIFSPSVTGYLLEDNDSSNGTQVLEIIRNISKPQGA